LRESAMIYFRLDLRAVERATATACLFALAFPNFFAVLANVLPLWNSEMFEETVFFDEPFFRGMTFSRLRPVRPEETTRIGPEERVPFTGLRLGVVGVEVVVLLE